MRIGVNCCILQPDMGGIKQYFLTLFRELLASDQDNEYLFFYCERNKSELEKLGRHVVAGQGILLQSQRDIKKHLDRIDLYFCPFGSIVPRPLTIPSVVTIADIQEIFFPDFFTFHNLMGRYWHFVGSTKMADHVVTISSFSKESIVRYHRIRPDKITVSHLCADERFYRAAEVGKRPAAELPDRYIVYPANRWLHKNHDVLLRAMAWLRDNKQVKVNAVFTGYDQRNLYSIEEKAAEYGLAGQVFQLGYVSVEELAYLYRHAELMVFPSLFEGFGIPLVEAMAAGCPVLSSDRTSLPEVGGKAVAYFDPFSPQVLAKALLNLLSDRALREQFRARGLERAKDFSVSDMAQDHLLAFAQASQSYSWTRFLYLRWCYKYIHMVRTLARAAVLVLHRVSPFRGRQQPG